MTLKNTETRYKPNVFNNLHIIKRKALLIPDVSWEEWLEDISAGALRDIYGLTRSESSATLNMYKTLPEHVQAFYAGGAAVHGMVRGPWSHLFFSGKAIGLGYTPAGDAVSDYDMTDRESTCMLIARRSLHIWSEAPPGLRKMCTPEKLIDIQKICRTYEIYAEHFASLLPGRLAGAELETCLSMFFSGSHDDIYLALGNEKPWPIDVSVIPDLKAALLRLATVCNNEEVEQRAELKRKVESATFEQVELDMASDMTKLRVYYANMSKVVSSWAQRVTSHKRVRREKGLAAVSAKMSESLAVITTEDCSQMSMEAAAMKVGLSKKHDGKTRGP